MPVLGMAQDTGKLISWLKKEGEAVVEGEPIMEVETDKAAVEIEATASGTLGGVLAREGDDVPVGQVIAWILEPGESPPVLTMPKKASLDVEPGVIPPAEVKGIAVAATPVAQKIAADHGIDLAMINPGGRAHPESGCSGIHRNTPQGGGDRSIVTCLTESSPSVS